MNKQMKQTEAENKKHWAEIQSLKRRRQIRKMNKKKQQRKANAVRKFNNEKEKFRWTR